MLRAVQMDFAAYGPARVCLQVYLLYSKLKNDAADKTGGAA